MTRLHHPHRPEFPAALDSTMLKAFRSCPQSMLKQYLYHWKPRNESIHLIAGKAFATGLEVMRRAYYERNSSSEESLALGVGALIQEYHDGCEGKPEIFIKEAKSLERMAGALEYYASVAFPLDLETATPVKLAGGRRAIEFSFALELDPELRHPVTGEPILYCGRADQIVEFAGGIWPEDDKTTGQLGERWADQWKLRSQFTGYTWAARQHYERVMGTLVTGIAIKKTSYDHTRVPSARPGPLVDLWLEQTKRDIRRMIECWQAGMWDYNLDESCNGFSGCIFRDVCGAADEQPWLESGFVLRKWNPISRLEEEIAAEEAANATL